MSHLVMAVGLVFSLLCYPAQVRAQSFTGGGDCGAQAEEVDVGMQLVESAQEAYLLFVSGQNDADFVALNFGYVGDYDQYLTDFSVFVSGLDAAVQRIIQGFVANCSE